MPALSQHGHTIAQSSADSILSHFSKESTFPTGKSGSRRPTPQERKEAGIYLAYLLKTYDHESAVELYLEKYPHCRPKQFQGASETAIDELFEKEDSWLSRLWLMQYWSLIDLRFYTLHAEHLGLPPECADPERCLEKENIARWKAAILEAFPNAPVKWQVEPGRNGGRVHTHVLSDHRRCIAKGILRASKSKKVVQPMRDEATLKSRARYCQKKLVYHWPTAAYPSRKMVLIWAEATQHGRLPQTGGVLNIPKVDAILEQVNYTRYTPGRVVTPGVWERARATFDACVSLTHIPAIEASGMYLKWFPDCLPDLFESHELPFNVPNLAAYIDFCRELRGQPRAVDNFFGKSGKNHLALFQDHRTDRAAFWRKRKRQGDYLEYLDYQLMHNS